MNSVFRFSLGTVLFFAIARCAGVLAADRPPEMVDDATAKAVWEKLVASTEDLDVFSRAKLITGVPAIAPCSGTSPTAAAMADILRFWYERPDGLGWLGPRSLPFIHAWDRSVEANFGKEVLESASWQVRREASEKIGKLQGAVLLEFYKGMPHRSLEKGVSGGQVAARRLQSLLERAEGATGPARVRSALASGLAAWDALVTAVIEPGSRRHCQESLSHDMPFLCFFGDSNNLRTYVCVGYAEGDGKAYWIAIDPSRCKLWAEPMSDIMVDGDRALGGDAERVIRGLSGGIVTAWDFETEARVPPIPGIVVLDAAPSAFTCLFVYDWRFDEKALADRVKRLMNAELHSKKQGAKP